MKNTINLNNAYIGVYYANSEYKIGLFVKTDVVSVKNQRFEKVQYYQDVLSNTTTALMLNSEGQDKLCDFSSLLSNEPQEKVNWKGIRGEMETADADSFKIPAFNGSIARSHHLIQFTSVYPNLTGQVSIEKIIDCLTDYCSKFEFKEDAKKQILSSLKDIPQYLLSQGEQLPTFENLQLNNIDLSQVSEDLTTDKKVKK